MTLIEETVDLVLRVFSLLIVLLSLSCATSPLSKNRESRTIPLKESIAKKRVDKTDSTVDKNQF